MKKKGLSERDKEWIEEAKLKGYTRLQTKKKLVDAKYDKERIYDFLDYFEEIDDVVKEAVSNVEDSEELKTNVKQYFSDNKKNMKGKERRQVKKFLRNVEKYCKVLEVANKGFKKEVDYIESQGWDQKYIDRELKDLKLEVIDRLIESKQILDIPHPDTGEEITKENLKKVSIDRLIELMQDNVNELDLVVNGKITEEEDVK